MKKTFLAISSLLFSFSLISSANAVSTTGNVNATVVAPVTISETTAMSFGSFGPSVTLAGTIDTSGNTTNDVSKLTNGQNAVFAVTGEGNNNITFTLPADGAVTVTGPGTPMTVHLGTTTSYLGGSSVHALSSGSANVTVYGRLDVGANQTAGSYTGTYTASANY